MITHYSKVNPTINENVASGYGLDDEWYNTITYSRYKQKINGVWDWIENGSGDIIIPNEIPYVIPGTQNSIDSALLATTQANAARDAAIAAANAGGSPKDSYLTLAALQAAFPIGATGIYLVAANGHWYSWKGGAWTDGGVYLSSLPVQTIGQSTTEYMSQKAVTDELNGLKPDWFSGNISDIDTPSKKSVLKVIKDIWFTGTFSAFTFKVTGVLINYTGTITRIQISAYDSNGTRLTDIAINVSNVNDNVYSVSSGVNISGSVFFIYIIANISLGIPDGSGVVFNNYISPFTILKKQDSYRFNIANEQLVRKYFDRPFLNFETLKASTNLIGYFNGIVDVWFDGLAASAYKNYEFCIYFIGTNDATYKNILWLGRRATSASAWETKTVFTTVTNQWDVLDNGISHKYVTWDDMVINLLVNPSTLPTTYATLTSMILNKAASPCTQVGRLWSSVAINNSYTNKELMQYGDSITAGLTYYLDEFIAMVKPSIFTNKGVSGNVVSQVYDRLLEDLTATPTMLNTISLLSFFVGTNDYNGNIPLGSIADAVGAATFCGKYMQTIELVLTTKRNQRIMLINILNRNYNFAYGAANVAGYTVLDMCSAISNIGKKYSIPVLDFNGLSGWTQLTLPPNTTVYSSDGVHPSTTGGTQLARLQAKFIDEI